MHFGGTNIKISFQFLSTIWWFLRDISLLKKMCVNMELSDEVILFKENLESQKVLELELFKLSMLLSYNSEGNLAQLERESKQVRRQLHDIVASTASQKCLAMFRTNDKCTEAVIMLRNQFLNLKKMAINYCRKEKLYIPQKEIENLENDCKGIKTASDNYFRNILFTNMATVVWDQLVQKPIDNEELKVALFSFEIHHNKINKLQDKINQLYLDINRMQRHRQAYFNMELEIAKLNKLKASCLKLFSFRSCLRTIRRLTNGRCTQAVDVHMVMMVKSDKNV